MTIAAVPNPVPAAPRPAPRRDADALREAARTRSDELAREIRARLDALDRVPVTEHPDVFAEVHSELTERLRETER